MNEDLLKGILEYDDWATEKVIQRCAELSDEQLTKKTVVSEKTVIGQLIHLVSCAGLWTFILTGKEPGPAPSKDSVPTPSALLEMHKSAHAEMRKVALQLSAEGKLGESVTLPWYPVAITKLDALMTGVDHSTFHRSEIEIMLTTLGLEAFPDVAVYKWASR